MSEKEHDETPVTTEGPAAAHEGSKTDLNGKERRTNYIKTDLGELNMIESMCPKCQEMGTTRLMITSVPHFKEIIVSSFECQRCGEVNNEVAFGGTFGPKRVRYELQVHSKQDLDRQVVKSEFATIAIPELELEIPPESQKGNLNTVEGILEQTYSGLQLQQPLRKIQHPDLYEKIEAFCAKLESFRSGDVPFTLTLDDPAGNSYIEPIHDYYHPTLDPQLTKPGHLMMHECDIPYFKQTIIMAFKCEYCGYKSNEIKAGGEINPKGLRLTLHVKSEADLKRDVLKSDTATLIIPEVRLELAPGTLGGFFSTVEGTITQVRDQLMNLPQAAFAAGDSADDNSKTMLEFVKELDELLALREEFTFILDDPLGNVYIQNPCSHLPPPDDVDPKLEREEYTRTEEQDEELGIRSMRHNEEQANIEKSEDEADHEAEEKDGAAAEEQETEQ
ncbi:ZPR1 zinc-finger domain family protein [Leishmania donovani]|uniref:ZPR1 zinc-finger domain family protein n=1 Tax=Leishmania donovani TaxID=5661 RepID=A0A504XVE7_LEIDO|nr:ZPR1 zinc-finger domain family protein [Leishmania donovani]